MATWCAWDDNKKLTQLRLRLEGAARSFYNSCSEAERKSYDALKAALAKRFTPVRGTDQYVSSEEARTRRVSG